MAPDWEKLKAAQRMQDHIESHLGEPITLLDLARAARYSPWYAARVFKECTGNPPFEYIRLRRLSLAAQRIGHSRARIVDVAFDFVFDSHDGFTRAFYRQFGVTPTDYRQRRPKIALFAPPAMRDFFSDRQKGEPSMTAASESQTVFVQVIDRPARKLAVRRANQARHYFEYCEELGCDVWEELGRIEGALQEPMGLWLPPAMQKPGTSTYVQGVELPADYRATLPSIYDVVDLPACKLMVFQGPPFDDKDFGDAITSLWDAMSSYRPEIYGYAWADDDAPRFQLAPMGYRGYIEGRPVRALATR
jgi:AraC family transcriptional regulator